MSSMEYTGTVLSSSIILTKTILGPAMLDIPHAIAAVGLLQGVFLLIISALGSGMGLVLLSKCAMLLKSRSASFLAVTRFCFGKGTLSGKILRLVFEFIVALKCFGVTVFYLKIAGDLSSDIIKSTLVPNVEEGSSFFVSPIFCMAVAIILLSPFNYYRTLNALGYISAFGLFAVAYLLSVVVAFAFIWPEGMPTEGWIKWNEIKWWNFDLQNSLKYAPIFVFVFGCHQNIFPVHNELQHQCETTKTIVISVFSTLVIYLVIGILGYLSFGSSVSDHIISMYPFSYFVLLGEISIVLLVLFTYPLQFHPGRNALKTIVEERYVMGEKTSGAESSDEDLEIHAISQTSLAVISTFLMLSSFGIAASIDDSSFVLSVLGTTGTNALCFILPGLLYYKTCSVIKQRNTQPPIPEEQRLLEVSKGSSAHDEYDELLAGRQNEQEDYDEEVFLEEQEWVGTVGNKLLQHFSLFLFFFGLVFMVVCLWSDIALKYKFIY